MKITSTPFKLAAMAVSLCGLLSGCGSAKITHQQSLDSAHAVKPTVIYVSDFAMDAANVKADPGILPAPPRLPGVLNGALPPMPGTPKDSRAVARELVSSMSVSLVEELTDAGLNARRLAATNPLPTTGWLVRGVFARVNQGNQLRRAVVGFGSGKTDVQVIVDIDDLSLGTPTRFYELHTKADSGKAPGAGPTIVLGPAGVAARFIIAGKDLERNVRQTASKIAEEVAQLTKTQP
jgi:Domain of unknown function (DUF4410)